MNDPFDSIPSETKRVAFQDIVKLRKGNPTTPMDICMYWPESCSGEPTGSHSLSRCWLEALAFEGHVLRFAPPQMRKIEGQKMPVFAPEHVGVGEASVFKGFCNGHDTELFKTLDTLNFDPNLENCVRLIYRSVCREISFKQHIAKVWTESPLGQNETFFNEHVAREIILGLLLVECKSGLEAAISSEDYSDYEGLVFELDVPPSLIGTTTIIPFVTPRGRDLAPQGEFVKIATPGGIVEVPRMEWLNITVLPTAAGGFAILSWNRYGGRNSPIFAHSFRRMERREAEMMLPRVLFELGENVMISPIVWHRIPESVRGALVQRHMDCIVNSTTMPSADIFTLSPSVDSYLRLSVRDVYEVRKE